MTMTTYNSDVVLFNDKRFTYDGALVPPSGTSRLRARIAFDLAANGVGSYFTLDDAVKGELDNATYPLVGDVLVDVTDYLRACSIRRGRSRQLDRFVAGVASLTLDNRDRAYDPTNTRSPYYGSIVPRKQVIIDFDGVNLATMLVEDWDFAYALNGDSLAQPKCVDGFSLIAQTTVSPGTATAEYSGARVAAVLDDVGWPSGQRSIDTGQASLYADTIGDNVNALSYLQKVETSEAGALFIDADGAVAFRDRNASQSLADDSVVFGPGGVPFSDIAVVYGTEEMANTVSVTYPTGASSAGTATAVGTASVEAYGAMELTFDTLLLDASEASAFATYQVQRYAEPVYRVDSISVLIESLPAEQQLSVMRVELGDVARVNWRPNNIGNPISQYVVVDAIEHDAVPGQHVVRFTLSQALLGFVLDDATLGVLGTSTLGF